MGSVKGTMLGSNCFMGFGHKLSEAKRDLTDLPTPSCRNRSCFGRFGFNLASTATGEFVPAAVFNSI
jgi:hypothetical protein